MERQYRVIGIVQSMVNGSWFERPINVGVWAFSPGQAKELALAMYIRVARHEDERAIVRWYTPSLVRVLAV